MKKFIATVVLGLASLTAFAEASFDQIEGLIQQKNYAAAASGLEGIIQNHPKSAKAFYAMAQAQAGLGNLEKANKALTIAQGLNPTLDFAPEGSVQKLKQAITPQVEKIEAVEESHVYRNMLILLAFGVVGFAIWFGYNEIKRQAKEREEEAELSEKLAAQAVRQEREAEARRMTREREEERQRQADLKAEEALKAHKNYNHERFDPANPDKLKSVAQFKREQAEAKRVLELREAQARAEAAEASARMYRTSAQAVQPTHTTVVNNGSSTGDFAMGMVLGNMMGSSHHHDHDTTIIREREVVRETPKRDSSWDDTPTPSISTSRSSSWDDTPSSSSSRSSSWDDDSSSRSSSSWSSSSSSDSSSSWSDSSSSSSSSSSWD